MRVYSVYGFPDGFVGTEGDRNTIAKLYAAAVAAAKDAWPQNPSPAAGGLGSFPGAAHEAGIYLALVCPGREAEEKIQRYLWVDRPFVEAAYRAVREAGIRLGRLTAGLAAAKRQWDAHRANPDAWRVENAHENHAHIAWDFVKT